MEDEENLSYKTIRVTDGGGIALPADPRRDLRALRRAYEEGTHHDIVALKKRARLVWKKLKASEIPLTFQFRDHAKWSSLQARARWD